MDVTRIATYRARKRAAQSYHPSVWTPADAIHTANQFHAELDRAERGTAVEAHPERTARVFSMSRYRKARIMDALAVALLLALMAALGVVGYAASAHADSAAADAWAAEYGPAACDLLAEQPTLRTLTGILAADMQMGADPQQAGEDVATAVWDLCPAYIPLLRQFVALYGGRTTA